MLDVCVMEKVGRGKSSSSSRYKMQDMHQGERGERGTCREVLRKGRDRYTIIIK